MNSPRLKTTEIRQESFALTTELLGCSVSASPTDLGLYALEHSVVPPRVTWYTFVSELISYTYLSANGFWRNDAEEVSVDILVTKNVAVSTVGHLERPQWLGQ